MNCEKCKNLLSEFLDDELCAKERIAIEEHLAKCLACVEVFEDFSMIKVSCDEVRQEIVGQLVDGPGGQGRPHRNRGRLNAR